MPQETIRFPAAYVAIGAYRLLHDPSLWRPMWEDIRGAAKKAGIVAGIWAVITWPIQRAFVGLFMKSSSRVLGFSSTYKSLTGEADRVDGSLGFKLPFPSLQSFAVFMFVLHQCSTIIELFLRKRLRAARSKAYAETVRSRGKAADWWTDYVEEWQEPPTEKALKQTKKQAFYTKLATPIVRMIILKVFLLPLDWVPFMSLIFSAFIRSLSFGRQLHAPFFAAKRMNPLQVEIWITERNFSYRQFGFAAALLENFPIVGILFSISNRCGAAMWAHDLEKRQQMFGRGELKKLTREETYSLSDPRKPSSPRSSQSAKLPVAPQGEDDFHIPGASLSSASAKASSQESAAQSAQFPSIPKPYHSGSPSSPSTAPPAYTPAGAEQVIAGSASGAGSLGIAPSHAEQISGEAQDGSLRKRKVPPPPLPKRS